jgi:hypothetical protein
MKPTQRMNSVLSHLVIGPNTCLYYVIRTWLLKPEGMRQLGRCRRRLEDNIKINLKENMFADVDWIQLM